MNLPLPPAAARALALLNRSGFEAYVVGGCVRDCLCGRTPDDWDITTSALPEETCGVFRQHHVIPTGIQHGTVTVLLDGMPLEITTYRVDGSYGDGRHPDRVSFSRSLEKDLRRRDFTINALAYHPESGLTDLFGGREDLKNGILRCVGDPAQRFHEDALRILRALRFSSVLNLTLDPDTAQAAHGLRALLAQVSAERINTELQKLICGPNACAVLLEFPDVIGEFLPEILPGVGFDQQNPYHIYPVWEHSVRAMAQIDPVPALRLTMLLHDCGKPACFSRDERGGHFYGHAEKSTALAKQALIRLRFDNKMTGRILTLIQYHDVVFPPARRVVRRWLGRLTPDLFFDLLRVKRADTCAQAPAIILRRLETLAEIRQTADEILREAVCFSLRNLAVNGDDLIAAGIPRGKEIGATLNRLLEAVIDESCPNEKAALLALAIPGRNK